MELHTPLLPLDSSIQMVSGSLDGLPKWTHSKTDWTVLYGTWFRLAISEKERGLIRARRMES